MADARYAFLDMGPPGTGKSSFAASIADVVGAERTLALEPSRREMTVQDLMRHTSGFTYGIFGDSLVQRANRAANTMDDQQTNAELIDKLAKLPLPV